MVFWSSAYSRWQFFLQKQGFYFEDLPLGELGPHLLYIGLVVRRIPMTLVGSLICIDLKNFVLQRIFSQRTGVHGKGTRFLFIRGLKTFHTHLIKTITIFLINSQMK